jgi:hypothetical protein
LGDYRVHLEYADTACEFTRKNPGLDCATGKTPVSFRRATPSAARIIGHPMDNDGRMLSVGGALVRTGGDFDRFAVAPRRARSGRDVRSIGFMP